MARVLFISLYDRNAYGQRIMSANLKRNGHTCEMVFLKRYDTKPTTAIMEVAEDEYPWMGINRRGRIFKFASNSPISETELDLLRDLVEELDPQVIGMTVNTPLRSQAKLVTRFLREHFDIPILWGGYDPTVNPEACLAHADYVCTGEGDQTVIDIANCIDAGVPFDSVPNLAYVRDGQTYRNPKHPAEQVLDNYPWRDNEPVGKYFIENNRLERNHTALNDREPGTYLTMSARGCPYKCTYCCEATMKDVYSGEKYLRRRSVDNVIAELVQAKERFGLQMVHFDDEIFAMDVKWLEKFSARYRREVGVPFVAYIYPTRNIEAILGLLKDAGLVYCCLALESGSERVNREIFQRVYNRELFLQTANYLNVLGIKFYTDIITYSPYEEEEDLRATLEVLMDLSYIMDRGFDIWVNKLFVLPGTKLAKKMAQEGVEVGPSHMDALFNLYARLYWIASFCGKSRPLITRILEMPEFRKAPWLLDTARVEEWLETHTPMDAIDAMAEDFMPESQSERVEARADYNEDHDSVVLPTLSLAGCH